MMHIIILKKYHNFIDHVKTAKISLGCIVFVGYLVSILLLIPFFENTKNNRATFAVLCLLMTFHGISVAFFAGSIRMFVSSMPLTRPREISWFTSYVSFFFLGQNLGGMLASALYSVWTFIGEKYSKVSFILSNNGLDESRNNDDRIDPHINYFYIQGFSHIFLCTTLHLFIFFLLKLLSVNPFLKHYLSDYISPKLSSRHHATTDNIELTFSVARGTGTDSIVQTRSHIGGIRNIMVHVGGTARQSIGLRPSEHQSSAPSEELQPSPELLVSRSQITLEVSDEESGTNVDVERKLSTHTESVVGSGSVPSGREIGSSIAVHPGNHGTRRITGGTVRYQPGPASTSQILNEMKTDFFQVFSNCETMLSPLFVLIVQTAEYSAWPFWQKYTAPNIQNDWTNRGFFRCLSMSLNSVGSSLGTFVSTLIIKGCYKLLLLLLFASTSNTACFVASYIQNLSLPADKIVNTTFYINNTLSNSCIMNKTECMIPSGNITQILLSERQSPTYQFSDVSVLSSICFNSAFLEYMRVTISKNMLLMCKRSFIATALNFLTICESIGAIIGTQLSLYIQTRIYKFSEY